GIETVEAHAERIDREGKRLKVILSGGEPIYGRTVIAALGRSGNHRTLDVPGEDLDKVFNRLYDPKDFRGQKTLVVGGGDSAMETAIALAKAGSEVTLTYRKKDFSRPKPENVDMILALSENPNAEASVEDPDSERVTTASGDFLAEDRGAGSLTLKMPTDVVEIRPESVILRDGEGNPETIPNDVVFTMIGREPPLDFFRRSGVRIQGEWGIKNYAAMASFILFCVWMYLWKSGGNPIHNFWVSHSWFPYNLSEVFSDLMENPKSLLGTIAISMTQPAFYYGLAYALIVSVFGWRRIARRRTPYVTKQTLALILIQVIPLFILPYILLPWMGHNGWLPRTFADIFFPVVDYDPHGREYWRAAGFILAWPLFIHNVFTNEPLWGWLVVCFLQTFVLIPAMIYFWGKGAYCGWICSCGALAETLGDTHRTKMPHGPKWNRLNMAGQVILFFGFFLLLLRILAWLGVPGLGGIFYHLNDKVYKFTVDIFLAGIIGVGLYFWFSGRVWCRFFCPLAALMHIYTRFSRFRILSEKKKCISCNVCTSVCHQGIDVMNFANKGVPMNDPECVRCSACVQSCPTGVLYFGQVDSNENEIRVDKTPASPVRMNEGG
ncbi:MAG: NAD(P)-binding domain-containing protein, partial [Candidatus Omnitrophica bacterium]|nr:NAD(P)-binding domain-containing protein [Candidatus Omnitrophota bacterium]